MAQNANSRQLIWEKLEVSKIALNKIFDLILEVLSRFPQGASIVEVHNRVKPHVSRRSLQRYLSFLEQDGRLYRTGKTRSLRYHKSEIQSADDSVTEKMSVESLLPLSPSALSIQKNVSLPIQARKPVGYNQEFLNRYQPNRTYYLSESTRKKMLEVGNSSNTSRPAGTYARKILNRLLIDLSWNSSRLEGNTYTLLETERLLELGETPEGKDSFEAQMILNHKAAIEFMVDSAGKLCFNSYTICNLHALLAENLLRDPHASGSLRVQSVGIAKSVYQPLAIPQLLEEYFQKILNIADAILDPFEQAFFAIVHLPYLQPFLDVNKRVSRLAANIPLIRQNLCPLSFVDVPEHPYICGLLGVYELNQIELLREVFVWAYERSGSLYSATRQELGDPDPFRMRYRNLIKKSVAEVIQGRMDKQAAVRIIKDKANEILKKTDRDKFIEVVETELMSIHQGNIARYRITPLEYEAWQEIWR